jgi:hypothetical protein
MKISELRKQLEDALAEHGDVEVRVEDRGCGCCSDDWMPAKGVEVQVNRNPERGPGWSLGPYAVLS